MRREWVPLYAVISTSVKFADLASDTHRLFYTLLLAQCDAWGRIEAIPRVLRAMVWPLLDHDVAATAAALDDCLRVGLVALHEREGVRWLQIPDWEDKAGRLRRNDRVAKAGSKFPAPSQNSRTTPGVVRDNSGSEERREEQKEKSPADAGSPPSPAPPATASPSKSRERRKATEWTGELPEVLRTPEFRAEWDGWLRYRRSEHKAREVVTQSAGDLQLDEFEAWGAARAVRAMVQVVRAEEAKRG